MDNGNDDEPHPETPKMNINFNSNDQKLNENINHEDPQKEKEKEKSINTETKTTTNKVNTEAKIEIIPTIQNLVSTAKLNCDLRLREISLQEQNTQYNPKRFSGLILRMHNPLATSLIFSNGKIIVLGAKTEEDSKKACDKIGKIIKSLNYPVKLTNFKIQNIVGSCDVRFQINLYKLNSKIKEHVKSSRVAFEPEIFPGLIYRLIPNKSQNNENNEKSPNIAFLIFNSGKIVITGGKNRNQIYEAFNKVYPLLYQAKSNIPIVKNN
jgi:transcription initiation factor TFIID TATA-box-binding protein